MIRAVVSWLDLAGQKWIIRPSLIKFMRSLTACLMFRDSASYLEEWLQFHLRVGVEHFYLYDNESQDDFESVIQPLVAAGKITLHRWPGEGGRRQTPINTASINIVGSPDGSPFSTMTSFFFQPTETTFSRPWSLMKNMRAWLLAGCSLGPAAIDLALQAW